MKVGKTLMILIVSFLLIIVIVFLFFTKGKIFDKYDNLLKVNNKSDDTLCFWFAPLPSNQSMFNQLIDKGYQPSLILPKRIESYPAPNWRNAIKRVKGGTMYLLDYSTIMKYKKNKIILDSNLLINIFRYRFTLDKNKLDSCNWIITYDKHTNKNK
jgi:hypothetical protein